jgi:hypothetical protein
MNKAIWIYAGLDPLSSGELRRLGVPALAVDGDEWACDLAAAESLTPYPDADVAVVALQAAGAIRLLRPSTKVVIEVDTGTSLTYPEASAVLRGLANRIDGVVARGIRAAAWAGDVLGAAAPVWLIPDPAVRRVEIAAAALERGVGLAEPALDLPDGLDLWFCEPGDHIGAEEIAALAAQWCDDNPLRVVVAPPLIAAWIKQVGVMARIEPWSPSTLHQALTKAERCTFLGPENYVQARRRVVALRSGAPAQAPPSPGAAAFEPSQVAASWAEVLSSVLATAAPEPADKDGLRVLLFLDLIQDLDPVLPLIDELQARRGVEVQIAATTWLLRHSPRATAAIQARGLAIEPCNRPNVLAGTHPSLNRIDAVVVVAESSLRAHACSHALVERARAERIPTFAFQHGVENVGLHPVAGEEDAAVAADHLFVWFPADRAPPTAPLALQPRMVHVGRTPPPHPHLGDLSGTFSAFDSIVAVFENLHWIRYDHAWRTRFLAHCTEFAFANPSRAVILKPHHAGLWSVKNRDLIPQWPPNLVVADPTDPFWEPYTAPALVQLADLVITTPSTVALDAVQARKPVAVAAYGLELAAYAPLPMLQRLEDWTSFCAAAGSVEDARRRGAFLSRTSVGERAPAEAADAITTVAVARRRLRRAAARSDRVSA